MQNNKKHKVIIVGSGVSGLTVAHELSRFEDKYDIHIYERNSVIGGMARSSYTKYANHELPTEYCWRIYGPNYYNLREVLKEIPLTNNSKKTVHDNLIDIRNYLIADKNEIILMNNTPETLMEMRHAFKNISFRQKWRVLSKIFYCFMIATTRLNKMDDQTWDEYINPNNSLSHDMRKYIVDIMGPYLGADITKVNVPSVVKTLESFKVFNHPISVMNGPTNESWFDHWQHFLEAKGVAFHFNTNILDIGIENNEAKSIILENSVEIAGDTIFCSVGVDSAVKFPSLNRLHLNELAKRGYQLMVGIQLYFDQKIELPEKNTALYIPDSPWQLIIEPQGLIWNKTYDKIQDFWSIGLCDSIRPGELITKPFIECTHEEICKEVWHQILNSVFAEKLSLSKVKILTFHIWDSYLFNGKALQTNEPKFSTNKGTYFLRPTNKTTIKNFYFAAAYTRTETDMFEMESAAESGKRAAQELEKSVNVIPSDRPALFAPYRLIDSIFPQFDIYKKFPLFWYCLGLPFALVYSLGVMVINLVKNTTNNP